MGREKYSEGREVGARDLEAGVRGREVYVVGREAVVGNPLSTPAVHSSTFLLENVFISAR